MQSVHYNRKQKQYPLLKEKQMRWCPLWNEWKRGNNCKIRKSTLKSVESFQYKPFQDDLPYAPQTFGPVCPAWAFFFFSSSSLCACCSHFPGKHANNWLESHSCFHKQAVEKHLNFTLKTGVTLLLGFFLRNSCFQKSFFSPLAFSVQAFVKIPVVTLKEEGERVQGRSELETNVCVPSRVGCSRQRRPGRQQRNGAIRWSRSWLGGSTRAGSRWPSWTANGI